MIGQSQVTEPLMTALRTNRVNHAYLFSGPRGCGKTTSARILARCLNCAEGPTDTPCGVCPSCVELARDGGGSLDVVEIDAASHNGVDDARDLRERAVYAPVRDRYKIFILDEAHMVTPQGFNALLKLVEEPPDHVKFIFATTEPEKVIGTIRSRTHHYPFRLIAPAVMLDYIAELSTEEGVSVEPGVLPLVVRAGGGSARDTLSLLDQIIAGSEGQSVSYERAVNLLGYTHSALLNEVVDALAAADAATAFAAVDRVIQTGQDPRRFVEDLLERLRDLIIVDATRDGAAALLRGVAADEIETMQSQARNYGGAALSHAADVVNDALTDMVGATSPRLHLELMIARLLVEAVPGGGATRPAAVAAAPAPASAPAPAPAPAAAPPAPPAPATTPPAPATPPVAVDPVTIDDLREVWDDVVAEVGETKAMAGIVVATATPRELSGDVLTLVFPTEKDAAGFRPQPGVSGGVHEILRDSIAGALGITVKFRVSVDGVPTAPVTTQPVKPAQVVTPAAPASSSTGASDTVASSPNKAREFAVEDDGWATAVIPGSETSKPATEAADTVAVEADIPDAGNDSHEAQFGESLVRQMLGATFIGEEQLEQSETERDGAPSPMSMLPIDDAILPPDDPSIALAMGLDPHSIDPHSIDQHRESDSDIDADSDSGLDEDALNASDETA